MNIEPIIYNTTRILYNLEDKLSISSLFLFCYGVSSVCFSELLYTNNHDSFISRLNIKYKDYEIDLSINLSDKNIRDCFKKTIDEVIRIYDKDGYYKALYEKDPFALVIYDITKFDFDKIIFNKKVRNIREQLKLF